MSRSIKQQQQILIGVAAVTAVVSITLLAWHLSSLKQKSLSKQKQLDTDNDEGIDDVPTSKKDRTLTPKKGSKSSVTVNNNKGNEIDTDPTPRRTNLTGSAITSTSTSVGSTSTTAASSTTISDDEKLIHTKIEDLDKLGKSYFKDKKYLQAAETFTEALNYLSNNGTIVSTNLNTSTDSTSVGTTTNLLRQQVTLLNNRSAMYEKAEIYDLAIDDCVQILELEITHTKARLRKLRIHEVLKQHHDALIEICAIQLLFMQMNRVNLQRNLPVPPPPIPQSKMEEVLNEILPSETEKYVTLLNERNAGIDSQQPLPGHYTILQLLRSYTEYNAWMAMAAKDGSVETITNKLKDVSSLSINDQALLYYQRGRRYIYDRKYEEASNDFEQALALVRDKPIIIAAMKDDSYARILEWTGMVRHWHYKLDDALSCLQEASKIEPTNALIIVKQAGIQLDAGKQDEALQLFDQALKVDPNSVDALLHRSNLRIMQNNPELAKKDLEKCIQLRPSHTMARLRLASILVPMEDMDGAKRQIELAEQSEPNSSEVHSYHGELHFAKGEMDDARIAFEKAIQLEPFNPTPYVNAAMAVINTVPSPGQMPDTGKVVKLLEQAIEVDPQFAAAYVHLGQLKLGTATNLAQAREVVQLYDIALTKCRTPEEVKELCSMRILAVAQVEAAEQLKIDNFNLMS